jgi:PAS domain S-box-containing protein
MPPRNGHPERRSDRDRRTGSAAGVIESPEFKSFCHAFVESVEDYAVVFFDEQGYIRSWNPAAERMFGYTAEEVRGIYGDLIFTPEDRAESIPAKELTLARDTGHARDDRWHVRKDGSRLWANGDVEALYQSDGSLMGFSKVIRDRTDIYNAMQRLQDSQARLSQSNLELERFASIVSHDLQNPLYKIASRARELDEAYGRRMGLEAIDALADIRETAERMAEMVKGILNYSRLGKLEVEQLPVSVKAILADVLADLQDKISGSSAEVIYGDLPEVVADSVLLYQLFLNLISNGLKFVSGRPPRIEVRCEEHPTLWRFQVSDNGVGIPADQKQRIFGFLERGQDAPGEGLGIGLAICKRIVDRLGGEIGVESTPGQGSTFHFSLPKPEQPPA